MQMVDTKYEKPQADPNQKLITNQNTVLYWIYI